MNWRMLWFGMHAGIPAKAVILLPIGGVTLMDETRQTAQPCFRDLEA